MDTDHRRACVSRVPLFSGLDAQTLAQVADLATSRRFQRGERIQGPGDDAALLVVHRGRVRVTRLASSGAEHLLRILDGGDFLGETAVLTDAPPEHLATAMQDAEICRLATHDVRTLVSGNPALGLQLATTPVGRLQAAESRLAASSTTSVARRLADRLLQLSEEQGTYSITLPSTKRDLAAWLGTTPETLSRRLGSFQDTGLVRHLPDGRIVLLDHDGLENVPDKP